MWFIYALSAAAGAAVVAICMKLGLQHVEPIALTVIFFGIMFLSLFIVAVGMRKIDYQVLKSITSSEWLYVTVAGIASALSYFLYILALQQGEACGVVAVNRLDVLFVVILSMIFLGKAFSIKAALGAFLMAFGAFLLAC